MSLIQLSEKKWIAAIGLRKCYSKVKQIGDNSENIAGQRGTVNEISYEIHKNFI
jgi:hypothetical protein